MELSKLEVDLLTDLAADTHGLWEVFEFVRLHQPEASDSEVFQVGRSLLERWKRRGWLLISTTPICPTSVMTLADALDLVDRQGPRATRYFEGAPSIDLSEKVKVDVAWLLGSAATDVTTTAARSPTLGAGSAGRCDCPCHSGRAVHPIPCSCRMMRQD